MPRELVLYCARHDFGTYVMEKTGNLKAVMDSMGHEDVKAVRKRKFWQSRNNLLRTSS